MVRALKNIMPSALIYNRNTGEVTSEIGVHKTTAITINSFLGTV